MANVQIECPKKIFFVGLKTLIDLRGNESDSPYIIDKYRFIIKLLSIKGGGWIYLLLLLIWRGGDIRLSTSNSIMENTNNEYSVNKVIYNSNYRIRLIINRIKEFLNNIQLIYGALESNNKNIDKYLTVNYIWYFLALKTSKIENIANLKLSFDFSPADAAIYAANKSTKNVAIIIPVFAKEADNYYIKLSQIADSFYIKRGSDYFPTHKIKDVELKININKKPKLKNENKKIKSIILIITTNKINHNNKIENIINCMKQLKEKYGNNIKYKLRPHPYEYKEYAKSKELKKLGFFVTMSNDELYTSDICITAGTGLIFNMALIGKPFIFVKEIDPYYPNAYEILRNPLLPNVEKISDLPEYKELEKLINNNTYWENIYSFIVN